MTVSKFEAKIGASNGTIGKCIRQGRLINSDTVAAIVRNFEDINPVSLITGEGEILKYQPEPLGEAAVVYLSSANQKVEDIQEVMEVLREKLNQSTDPAMEALAKDTIQIFDKLVREYTTQKLKLAEMIEYHQELRAFIKKDFNVW